MRTWGHQVFAPEGISAAPAPPELAPLLARISAYDSRFDPANLTAAYEIAFHAHEDQKRDTGEPYITHPLAVANILAGYRLDVSSIITALLHDVIEDTSVTLASVQKRFGAEVAGLVDGVTKLTRLDCNRTVPSRRRISANSSWP